MPEACSKLLPLIEAYQEVIAENRIHFINFNTLTEYLFLLKEVASNLALFGSKAVIYLAAAVSDFYIPVADMVISFFICTSFHLPLTHYPFSTWY